MTVAELIYTLVKEIRVIPDEKKARTQRFFRLIWL